MYAGRMLGRHLVTTVARAVSERRFASMLTALAFVVAGLSGVLGFVSTHTERLASVHTVAGLALLAAGAAHVSNNLKILARYVPRARLAFAAALALSALMLACSYWLLPPVPALLAWGKRLQSEGQPPRTSYETLSLNTSGAGSLLTLDIKAGPQFRVTEPEHGWEITPQLAAWIETEDGQFLDTLYVTHSEAKSDYIDGTGRSFARPAALPVYRHRAQRPSAPGASAGPDAISSASPTDNAYLIARAHTRRDRFVVMLELNSSFDYNAYYAKGAFPEEPYYSDDGNPAQPSVVYRALVDTQSAMRFTLMTAIGHGHHGGANGEIDPDLSHLTTALQIVDRIVVEVRSPS